ncbi:MAG: heme biosynthesis HemY N-terminal domain-containing protein [Betaproteobacteria bacterium]
MRWLFWLVALFALAVAVSLGARMNDGYVLLVFSPWRMEISLNLFLFALVVVLFVGYGVMRAVSMTASLPRRAKEYQQQRGREKSFHMLQDAIRLLFEGRYGQALRKADLAYETGNLPGLAALIAARSAQALREPAKQRFWVERVRADDPHSEAAALMLEAEMANSLHQYDDALAALRRLHAGYGRHIAALRLELRAQQGSGNWDEVLRLARQLEKRNAMPDKVTHEICLQAHLENIRLRAGDGGALLAYMRGVPSDEQDSRLALALARQLHGLGDDDRAADVIETQLDNGQEESWHDDLITLYGMLAGSELTARIARAERWLQGRPRDAGLLLALGRLCRRQRLWGKAQSYLEASLAVGQSSVAHLELARLFDELERVEDANRHFRQCVELQV